MCFILKFPKKFPRQWLIGFEVSTTNKIDVIRALHRIDPQIPNNDSLSGFDGYFVVFMDKEAFVAL